MLWLNRYIKILLVGTFATSTVWAQHKNPVPQSVTNLFNDLPVNDASAGSVLHERETAAEKIAGNIFVSASLNTKHCFVGEPVLYRGTLYSALQSESVIKNPHNLPGFITTELAIDNERPKYKRMNGKNYRVFSIRRLQLLPVQEGALNIDPLVVNNIVRYKDENDKEHIYSGAVQSDPVKLIVKPLPVKGRPVAFAGMVGKFSMEVFIQQPRVVAREADTLQVVIKGAGNFTDCKLPAIAWPVGIEHFPVQDQLSLYTDSFPFTGSKTFQIPFVVREPGKLVIPAISLAFFDPATAMYKTVSSKAIDINVLPAVEKGAGQVANSTTSKNSYHKIWFSAGALILFMTAIYFKRKRFKKKQEVPEQMIAGKETVIKTDYGGMIQQLQAVLPAEQYGVAFKNIVHTFIEQELGLTGRLDEVLVNELQQMQSPLAALAQQLLADCNRLMYSPGDIDAKMKQQMEAQLEQFINKVKGT